MIKQSFFARFSNKKNTAVVIGIVLLILVASFFRLYKISDYMTFLGDEGRDVLIAKSILEGHLTLLGPRSSAGDFFMGPIYYYMMAPFLWLWQLDPVGPAIMVALVGVLTVYLVYYVGKVWFGTKAAFFSAGLYTLSPLVLIYSRSSWNPNVVPLFALLSIYLAWKATKTEKQKLLLTTIVGLLFGIGIQLHYVFLFLMIAIILYVFITFFLQKTKNFLVLLGVYVTMFFGFLIGFSPFLAFEARHNFPNIRAIFSFMFSNATNNGQHLEKVSFFMVVPDVFFRIFGRLFVDYPPVEFVKQYTTPTLELWGAGALLLAAVSLFFLWKRTDKTVSLLLSLWLVVGVVMFGFYKKPIYDYYFVFLFPLPALLFGNAVARITEIKKWYPFGFLLGLLIVIVVYALCLNDRPFKKLPNRQKEQAKIISDFVISKTNNKPYNFAFISQGNSDHEYRYYLEILGHKPVMVDNPFRDPTRKSVTGQLLVVCDPPDCQPLGNPLFDVAAYGRAQIVSSWRVSVVSVYKLVPYHGK